MNLQKNVLKLKVGSKIKLLILFYLKNLHTPSGQDLYTHFPFNIQLNKCL